MLVLLIGGSVITLLGIVDIYLERHWGGDNIAGLLILTTGVIIFLLAAWGS